MVVVDGVKARRRGVNEVLGADIIGAALLGPQSTECSKLSIEEGACIRLPAHIAGVRRRQRTEGAIDPDCAGAKMKRINPDAPRSPARRSR